MNRAGCVAALLAALLLSACSGSRTKPERAAATPEARSAGREPHETSRPQAERYRHRQDHGPDAPPIDVARIPEPVPKAEPRSRYGNKPEYTVLGKRYRVMKDARGYVERGMASWYGAKFHGYMTSSFEPYDMYAFSAAHKTLPLPTYARVTNLENGKSVVVRVNDRGPFHDGRVIDLSYAAAVKIGIWPKGTGRVEVRAIDPDGEDGLPVSRFASAASPPGSRIPRAPSAGAGVYLQIGSFGDRANAERAAAQARRAGVDEVAIQSVAVNGRTVHRVRVGPLADARRAEAVSSKLRHLGLGTPRVATGP